MSDKFHDAVKLTVNNVVAKHLNALSRGRDPGNLVKDIADELSQMQTAPAVATRKTDSGVVLVLGAETLLHKTAAELRSDGMTVSESVPDFARVTRTKEGALVFAWKAFDVTHEADDSPR